MKEERKRGEGSGSEEKARPESGAPRRVRPDERLDTVGLYCPIPIIKTQARMRTLAPGQVLEVLSDDRVILIDMPAWCRSTGNEYLGHHEEDGEIHLLVRKKQKTAPSGQPIRG
jgi:tRNA 2-thiouridine synthesizing protein A